MQRDVFSKCNPTFLYHVKCIIQQNIHFETIFPLDFACQYNNDFFNITSVVQIKCDGEVSSRWFLSLCLSPLCLSSHTMTRSQVAFELPRIRQLIKVSLSAEATSTRSTSHGSILLR